MTDTAARFPKRRFYGQAMQSGMYNLRLGAIRRNEVLDATGYTGRRVMGFKLPYWQREDGQWSLEQSVRFIESVWLGVGLGTYMVNGTLENPDVDQILLDGLQRMSAIQSYWNDEFQVPGDDGKPYYWSELTAGEHAHFDRIPFAWIETQYATEEACVEAYNRHNFGGTPHDPSERAVVAPKSV